jgi:hypothetical protein
MAGYLLQLNFALNVSVEEYTEIARGVAQPVADVDGLRWKIWFVNEAQHEAGGVYLFESRTAAEAYASGPIVENLRSAPFVSGLTVKGFDYSEELTEVTRGPVGATVGSKVPLSTTATEREVRLEA